MNILTLRVIKTILVTCEVTTSESLCERYKVSDRQLKRLIVSARGMGADIRSEKVDGQYIWVCHNADAVYTAGKLRSALELCTSGSLL